MKPDFEMVTGQLSKHSRALIMANYEKDNDFTLNTHLTGRHSEVIFLMANLVMRMNEITGLPLEIILLQLEDAVESLHDTNFREKARSFAKAKTDLF